MLGYKIRLRNRLLQFFYKPIKAKPRYISAEAMSFLDDLDKALEEKCAPLFADFFI